MPAKKQINIIIESTYIRQIHSAAASYPSPVPTGTYDSEESTQTVKATDSHPKPQETQTPFDTALLHSDRGARHLGMRDGNDGMGFAVEGVGRSVVVGGCS